MKPGDHLNHKMLMLVLWMNIVYIYVYIECMYMYRESIHICRVVCQARTRNSGYVPGGRNCIVTPFYGLGN